MIPNPRKIVFSRVTQLQILVVKGFCGLFLSLILIKTGQATEKSWLEQLDTVDKQRKILWADQAPEIMSWPLSQGSMDLIDPKNCSNVSVTPKERQAVYESRILTACLHPRKHFFEMCPIVKEEEGLTPIYYPEMAAHYILDTATRILEGPNGIKAVEDLSRELFVYFQTLSFFGNTALRNFMDENQAAKILGVVKDYKQSSYQALLTPKFVEWYQAISLSAHPERTQYGIQMNALPSQTFRLESSPYDSGKTCTLRELLATHEFSMDKLTPLRAPLETLYAQSFNPLWDTIEIESKKNRLKTIALCRQALRLSDTYRVFGNSNAVKNVSNIEYTLSTLLQDTLTGKVEFTYDMAVDLLRKCGKETSKGSDKATVIHHARIALLNEGISLLSHSTDEKAPGLLNTGLVIYGGYLNQSSLSALKESLSSLQIARVLLEEAYKKNPKASKEFLGHVENNIGSALVLNIAASDHRTHEEMKALFQNALAAFKHAHELGCTTAQANVAATLNKLGQYFYTYAQAFESDLSGYIQRVKFPLKPLQESKARGCKEASLTLNNIGVDLHQKVLKEFKLLSQPNIAKLFETSLEFLGLASQGQPKFLQNFRVVTTDYGIYLLNSAADESVSLSLDERITLFRKSVERLSEAHLDDPQPFINAQNHLGAKLLIKAHGLPDSSIEKIPLFEEGLRVLGQAAVAGHSVARDNYIQGCSALGTYALTRPLDEAISFLRKTLNFLEQTDKWGKREDLRIANTQNELAVRLTQKTESVTIHSKKTKLFDESLQLFQQAQSLGCLIAKTNLGATHCEYGCYLFAHAKTLSDKESTIPLLKLSLEHLKMAKELGIPNADKDYEIVDAYYKDLPL